MLPDPKRTMTTSTMKRSNNPLIIDIELLYADKYCVALHKQPGIPCQTKSIHPPFPLDQSLATYLNEPVKIWTRIDQPVSGIVLFYREQPDTFSQDYKIKSKTYLGLVEGHPPEHEQERQTLISYIRRDGKKKKSIEDQKGGKRAELSYTVLKKFDRYTLLQINPVTGRYHQIRQQLAFIGYPIKGDVKYGARRKNPDRSIHLHALEYVIQCHNGPSVKIVDNTLPDDPLWNLVRLHTGPGAPVSSTPIIAKTKNTRII